MNYSKLRSVMRNLDIDESLYLDEEIADDNNLMKMFFELVVYTEKILNTENENVMYDFVNGFEFTNEYIVVDLYHRYAQQSIEFILKPNKVILEIMNDYLSVSKK